MRTGSSPISFPLDPISISCCTAPCRIHQTVTRGRGNMAADDFWPFSTTDRQQSSTRLCQFPQTNISFQVMGLLWPTRLQLRSTGNASTWSQRQTEVRTGICFTPSPTSQRPKHPGYCRAELPAALRDY